MDQLRTFLFQTVYARSLVDSGGERIGPLMSLLFAHFLAHPEELPTLWGEPAVAVPGRGKARAGAADAAVGVGAGLTAGLSRERLLDAVTDYIAGMTDPFAQRLYAELGGEPPGAAGARAAGHVSGPASRPERG
jgi:dGTP triphosphohydrolase